MARCPSVSVAERRGRSQQDPRPVGPRPPAQPSPAQRRETPGSGFPREGSGQTRRETSSRSTRVPGAYPERTPPPRPRDGQCPGERGRAGSFPYVLSQKLRPCSPSLPTSWSYKWTSVSYFWCLWDHRTVSARPEESFPRKVPKPEPKRQPVGSLITAQNPKARGTYPEPRCRQRSK